MFVQWMNSYRVVHFTFYKRSEILRKSHSISRISLASRFQLKNGEFKRFFLTRTHRDRPSNPFERSDPIAKMHRVEAVLLISKQPINTRQISKLANLTDGTEARTLIRKINQKYDQGGRAFRVEKIAGGYQLMTRHQLASWVRRLHGFAAEPKLSDPALETLSIVAYRQPILRADIEQIRGVSCGEVLRQLMERKFVKIAGRSEELGRPFLYGTTRYFLEFFGLDKLEDLPKSDYFRKKTDNPFPQLEETLEDYGQGA